VGWQYVTNALNKVIDDSAVILKQVFMLLVFWPHPHSLSQGERGQAAVNISTFIFYPFSFCSLFNKDTHTLHIYRQLKLSECKVPPLGAEGAIISAQYSSVFH
jgi:hypothetical protein